MQARDYSAIETLRDGRAAEIRALRPEDRAGLLAAADAAARALSWPDVLSALSAHPRIGERAAGDSQEASWSRTEQSTAAWAGAAATTPPTPVTSTAAPGNVRANSAMNGMEPPRPLSTTSVPKASA